MIYHVREIDIADNLLQNGASRSEAYLGHYNSSMMKLFGEELVAKSRFGTKYASEECVECHLKTMSQHQ